MRAKLISSYKKNITEKSKSGYFVSLNQLEKILKDYELTMKLGVQRNTKRFIENWFKKYESTLVKESLNDFTEKTINETFKYGKHEYNVVKTPEGTVYAGKEGILGYKNVFIPWSIIEKLKNNNV